MPGSKTKLDPQQRRKLLFQPCQTKEDLHNWIKVFLGLDIPDCQVDPDSTSVPMELIWEIYQYALRNDRPDVDRILAFASRDSFKTLSASILEVLMLIHFDRSIAHAAAIEQQAAKSQYYVKKFLGREGLREFVVGDNKREVFFVHYEEPETGEHLTKKEWDALSEVAKLRFREHETYIRILVCTMSSMNSEHVPYMCVSGDTQLVVAADRTKHKRADRDRKSTTARGILAKMAGKKRGGNPLLTETAPLEITEPVVPVDVWSLNLTTGEFEFKRILRGHRRWSSRMNVIVGGKTMVVTPDHPFFVWGKGTVLAKDLVPGEDSLFRVGKTNTNRTAKVRTGLGYESGPDVVFSESEDEWEQVLLGSLLGDGGIYWRKTGTPYFQEQHCKEQAEYLSWKRSILSRKLRTVDLSAPKSGYTGESLVGFRTGHSPLLEPYRGVRSDLDLIDRLGPLGLAVWYMDDGCKMNGIRFSTEGFTDEQNERLRLLLLDKFGIDVRLFRYSRNDVVYTCLIGGVGAKRRLVEVCGPYVHPTMAYKFDLTKNTKRCRFCGGEFWMIDTSIQSVTCGQAACRLAQQGALQMAVVEGLEDAGDGWVYDFTVADNHNFVADGFLHKNCFDEIDLITNRRAYVEGQMIPAGRDGMNPLTLLTSTRKSYGLVQEEIDKAHDTGLQVRHWNIIDVTEQCPTSRHRPDLPRIPIYRSDDLLKAVSENEYAGLSSDQQTKYAKDEGYQGCLSNCRLFAMCRGRLADVQKSKSPMLKKITEVTTKFRHLPLDTAKAQLMCRKPSTEGLVYPRFSRDVHMLTAAQMGERILGEEPPQGFGRTQLLQLLRERDCRWWAGMDFGFTHMFAVVLAAQDGNNLFVIDAFEEPELELDQKIELCRSRLEPFNPGVWPDTAYPADIRTFRRHGFSMRQWSKGPGSVVAGIDLVRLKLSPTGGEPEMFFLAGDNESPGCEVLATRVSRYHWATDATGRITDKPDEEDDDLCDALRYLVMNVFGKGSKLVIPDRPAVLTSRDVVGQVGQEVSGQYTVENWMSKVIAERTGDGQDWQPSSADDKPKRRGRLILVAD